MSVDAYEIGYSFFWRIVFLLFGLFLLIASLGSVVAAFDETLDGAALPISLLFLTALLGLYMLPLIRARPHRLEIAQSGLTVSGDNSKLFLAWSEIKAVKLSYAMPLLPALAIELVDNGELATFLDANPRSFLATTTRFVQVLRRYPWIIRKLFGIPKEATTRAALDWLERRYGGALNVDAVAARWRVKEIQGRIGEQMVRKM